MSTDVPLPPAPPARAGRGLLGWVATSNPFYVISAGLFLFGLRVSFGARPDGIDTWALMTGLTGYTLLLAAAALVLVRFARVWNDVRTVLLLVVLMFLATSVTFDELLALDPARGAAFNVAGLAFAVGLTEALLRGIRLRLPAGFRGPYYLTLALFFLYPIALTPVLRDPHGERLMWGLFGFAPAAGLVFLTLLPAIRRGPGYVGGNGSPWPWPYYPWSLFVFLGVAVVGRSFLLCWSFHLLDGANASELIFGPYFLVPFGLALAVLLLELGIVAHDRIVTGVALTVSLGLIVLAGVGHRPDAIYAEFLRVFMSRLGGSPLFLTVLAAAGFSVYAWGRGVPLATEALTVAVAGLSVVRPETVSLAELTALRVWPLAAAAGLQLAIGVLRREGWRLVIAGAGPGLWAGLVGVRAYLTLRQRVAGLDYLVLGVTLLPLAVLISLAKAGVLQRWWRAPRGSPVTGAGPAPS